MKEDEGSGCDLDRDKSDSEMWLIASALAKLARLNPVTELQQHDYVEFSGPWDDIWDSGGFSHLGLEGNKICVACAFDLITGEES